MKQNYSQLEKFRKSLFIFNWLLLQGYPFCELLARQSQLSITIFSSELHFAFVSQVDSVQFNSEDILQVVSGYSLCLSNFAVYLDIPQDENITETHEKDTE